ncbi:lipocalin-like domain-containing protein [Chryseobacterium sp. CT-SW4]|uniref:lipocalin family protein n=1 Tax=Chryseobacterium sp. SW-1 TaxID=3157343 RepID=UPI003B01622A
MNKIIYLILLFLFSCQAQKKEDLKIQKYKNVADYFLGTWKFVEKNYEEGEERKIYPLHECTKKYTWRFEKDQDQFFLTKNFTTGKDCSITSSSRRFPVTVENNTISYMEGDLKRLERYQVVNPNSFFIEYTDILQGKIRNIRDVYERQ